MSHMNRFFSTQAKIVLCVCCLTIMICIQATVAVDYEKGKATREKALKQGLVHYENNEAEKSLSSFKEALAATFPGAASGKSQGEEKLRSLFDNPEQSAIARYQLGLICEEQGKMDEAATLFRDALHIVSTQGATYLGVKDGCKSCHFKEWKSWKSTTMAKTFEVLKPGNNAEGKTKLKLDPQKDYTKDAKCLPCHTTGYNLPTGYKIPDGGGYKAKKAAENTVGVTCEACHGPGSKYAPVHKDVDEKKRKYKFEEFLKVGEYDNDASACTPCHNKRNPNASSGFHFNYEEQKKKTSGSHEQIPLKYREEG